MNRAGNLLRNTSSRYAVLDVSAFCPSLYQATRSMSSKLFIGGLSYATDDICLREAFSGYGEIIEAKVIIDRETGRSRGFGFVSFRSSGEASDAMQRMDGKDLHGRRIRVSYAQERSLRGFGDAGFRDGSSDFCNDVRYSGGYGCGSSSGGSYSGGGNHGVTSSPGGGDTFSSGDRAGLDTSEDSLKDDDSEPKNYANTRI